jgi:2-methylcitrate dehydratase
MARALVDGRVGLDSFAAERILDPDLRPIMAKISIVEEPRFTERRKSHREENAMVEVRLVDGSTIRREIVFPRGHPRNPMDEGELDAKFRENVVQVLPRADTEELRDRLWNLPAEPDLFAICRLFRRFRASQASRSG